MSTVKDIRPPQLAGSWYPANPEVLADSIDRYIAEAKLPKISGEIAALISPHAGHVYSGPVAGYAYKTLLGKQVDLVVVLSPFHQVHPGAILSTGHDAYQTPLGTVPVEQDSLDWVDETLRNRCGTGVTRVRNDKEHAIEVLLPFLQRSLPDGFSLLPLMIRDQHSSLMGHLGSVLTELVQSRDALLVASTDLSHFYPAEEAKSLDQTIIDAIQTLNIESLYLAEREGRGAACGLGPLAAVIWGAMGGGAVTSQVLNYAHSGDITGDHSRVVGYASAVLTRD